MAKRLILIPRDETILRTVHFYRYITALDIANLLYSPKSLTHVREILKDLCGGQDCIDNQYLFRFPSPRISGNTERIFTLGSRGRDHLANNLGIPVSWYFRPQYTKNLSSGLIYHNLTLTRFLVRAHVFCMNPGFSIKRVRISYELEKLRSNVIPDAWILFVKSGIHHPVLLEIDKASASKERFTNHVKARIEFIRSGEYQRMFESQGCIVAYATTGELPEYRHSRTAAMREWTMEALVEMDMNEWASIFRFAPIVHRTMYDEPLFEGKVWLRPDTDSPVPLLTG